MPMVQEEVAHIPMIQTLEMLAMRLLERVVGIPKPQLVERVIRFQKSGSRKGL